MRFVLLEEVPTQYFQTLRLRKIGKPWFASIFNLFLSLHLSVPTPLPLIPFSPVGLSSRFISWMHISKPGLSPLMHIALRM